jgi:hypothetical protein
MSPQPHSRGKTNGPASLFAAAQSCGEGTNLRLVTLQATSRPALARIFSQPVVSSNGGHPILPRLADTVCLLNLHASLLPPCEEQQ